jgi:Fur family iron response transcriptional regulator
VALARLLFEGAHRHVTAEGLHAEVRATRMPVSLATVYNALNQFRDAGLLREVVVAPGRSYFDTNTGHHHHFFVEPDGELHDFPSDKVTIAGLPTPPKGTRLSRVDVIVRVRR